MSWYSGKKINKSVKGTTAVLIHPLVDYLILDKICNHPVAYTNRVYAWHLKHSRHQAMCMN